MKFQFNKQTRIWSAIALLIVTAVLVASTQVFSQFQFDEQELQNQAKDLDSFIQEEKTLLTQYSEGKITQNYLKTQTEHINKGVLNFYQQFESAEIPDEQEDQIKQLEKQVFELSL